MRILAVACFLFFSLIGGVLADDWKVTKLRGDVEQMVDGAWAPLARGDVVPDDRQVRTLVGRVTLQRGAETIELGSGTRIEIVDEAGRRPYTTVRQYVGRVEVEAEVKNVEHFAVQTPYLVAIVKGTRFIVRTTYTGSDVRVRRGVVSVTNLASGVNVLLKAGQAAASQGNSLGVSGSGNLPPLLDEAGMPLGQGLLNGVGETVGALGSTVGGTVGALGSTVGGAVGGVGSAVGGAIGGGAGGAVESVTSTAGGAVESVTSTAGSVVSGATGAVGGALGSLL